MSFRLPLALFFLLALLLVACSPLPSDTGGDDHSNVGTIPFETLQKEYTASLTDSGYATKSETFVLRSEADEEAFLANYPQGTLPDINYSEQIVVGVLAGGRPNNSYEVTIDSVTIGTEVVSIRQKPDRQLAAV